MSKKMIALAVAAVFVSVAAVAEPTCKLEKTGDRITVTVANTGMVFTGGAQPPAGAITYPGTGRSGDVALSCSDNATVCQSAQWYLRFADAKFGWPGDNNLTDERAVACSYDPARLAQVCIFDLKDGQVTKQGKVRMHFSAKIGGSVIAAYQPQSGGCTVEKDKKGNPHMILSSQ